MSAVKSNKLKSYHIPWGAWYGDESLKIDFPVSWEVDKMQIVDAPGLQQDKIIDLLNKPYGRGRLKDSVKNKKKIVIAVEDITRPAHLELVLLPIVNELLKAGIEKEKITFLICNGAHAPMLNSDIRKKIGLEILKNFIIHNHNPYDNLSDTGIILGKTPVRVNRYFHEADFRIIVGSIIPHSFAGFSSGAKLVLPGLADIATLERSHKYVMMGFRGGVNDVETNKFRSEIEDVVSKIGIDFFIGVVPNSKREPAGIFAGDLIEAHRKGVDFARIIFQTHIQHPSDIAVLNAYPKDSELLQADAALTPLKTIPSEIVKEKGVYIICTKCSNGFGYHSLFGPGMRLTRKPIKKGFLKGRDLIVFSPNVNQAEFKMLYWEGYYFADTWESVLSYLKEKYPAQCKISIYPNAPLQLLEGI